MNTRTQMNRYSRRWRSVRIAGAALAIALPQAAFGEDRQFLVILAHSPKQFGGGMPPGGLTNPQFIDRQYFDRIPNNGIDSFLEYWEEISYGDVRIQPGHTTNWVVLPWSIEKQNQANRELISSTRADRRTTCPQTLARPPRRILK